MCENVHFITFLQHLYYPFISTIDVLKLIFKNTQLIKLINNLSQDKNRIHDFHIIIKKNAPEKTGSFWQNRKGRMQQEHVINRKYKD